MPEQKTEPKLFGFSITWEEVKELIKPNRNPEGIIKLILTVIGVVLTPVVLFGVLFGYKRAYKRFYATEALMPYLNNLKPIAKFAMALGGIGIIVVCYFAYQLIAFVSGLFLGSDPRSYIFILLYFLVMLVFTLAVLLSFNK